MDLIGKEVYVEVGSIEGWWRRKKYKRGRVIKKYNGWYLVEIERRYLSGVHRMDIKEREEIEKEGELENE